MTKKSIQWDIMNGTAIQTDNRTNRLRKLEVEVVRLKEEIAEMILLEDKSEAVSVYSMSYEQQAELDGRARL